MVLGLSWQIASIWIAGFASVAVFGWALFRSPPHGAPFRGPELEQVGKNISKYQAEILRAFDGLRAEMAELRSQVSDIQRLLKEVD